MADIILLLFDYIPLRKVRNLARLISLNMNQLDFVVVVVVVQLS